MLDAYDGGFLEAWYGVQVHIHHRVVFVRKGVKPSEEGLTDFTMIDMVFIVMPMSMILRFFDYTILLYKSLTIFSSPKIFNSIFESIIFKVVRVPLGNFVMFELLSESHFII